MEANGTYPEIKWLESRTSRWDELVSMSGSSSHYRIQLPLTFCCVRLGSVDDWRPVQYRCGPWSRLEEAWRRVECLQCLRRRLLKYDLSMLSRELGRLSLLLLEGLCGLLLGNRLLLQLVLMLKLMLMLLLLQVGGGLR